MCECEPDGERRSQSLSAPSGRESSPDPAVCLILRADAEMRWLSREVIPVLRDAERGGGRRPEHGRAAAIAYLEVLWTHAQRHAAATELAFVEALNERGEGLAADPLERRAREHHEAALTLRERAWRRVEPLLAGAADVRTPLARAARSARPDAGAAAQT
ncbi:MAG: hypothetical protein ACYCUM_06220 [Solirubrobacteraceae bacterium]